VTQMQAGLTSSSVEPWGERGSPGGGLEGLGVEKMADRQGCQTTVGLFTSIIFRGVLGCAPVPKLPWGPKKNYVDYCRQGLGTRMALLRLEALQHGERRVCAAVMRKRAVGA
jgi:hypothetical protein